MSRTSGNEGLVRFLVRGSAIALITRVIGVGLGYAIAIIISRLLGAEGYGTYSIAMAWALLLVVPSRAGLDTAALKFAPVYLERGDQPRLKGFINLAATCVLGCSIIAGAGVVIAARLGLTSIPPGVSAATALTIFPVAALGLVGAMLRAERRIFASQAYEQVLRPVVTILLLVGAVFVAWPISASAAVLFGAAGAFSLCLRERSTQSARFRSPAQAQTIPNGARGCHLAGCCSRRRSCRKR